MRVMVHDMAVITKGDINYCGGEYVDLSVKEMEDHKGKYYEPEVKIEPKPKIKKLKKGVE